MLPTIATRRCTIAGLLSLLGAALNPLPAHAQQPPNENPAQQVLEEPTPVAVQPAETLLPRSTPLAAPSAQQVPAEFYQDFRGNWRPTPPWRLVGPDAEKVINPESGGLRITLSAQRRQTEAVGLLLDAHLKEDVEITVGYDILHADKPSAGHGVGFELHVVTDTPADEGLGLLRVARINEGDVYLSSRITTRDGKRQYQHGFTPTTSKSGHLRLRRVGKEATLSAADGTSGEFQALGGYDLGSEDLTMIRLSAFTGHAPNAVDVLIKDLRVRALSSAELKVLAAPPPDAPNKSREGRRGSLVAAGIVALLIALVALGAWLYARHSQPSDRSAPSPAAPRKPKAAAVPAAAQGVCPGCGKDIRARANLAGKKVKCSHCGSVVRLAKTGGDESI